MSVPSDVVSGTPQLAITDTNLDNNDINVVPTGTNEHLSAITWVDDGMATPYFVIVGNDGTVLTNQQ